MPRCFLAAVFCHQVSCASAVVQNEDAAVVEGNFDGFEVLHEMIEEGAEAEIEALAEAREEADEAKASAAEVGYFARVGEIVDSADRYKTKI